MPDQQKKIPKVAVRIAAWFSARTVVFLIFHMVGASILPLYEQIDNQNPMTQFGILLMQMNGKAWLVLFETGVVASIF